MLEVCAFFRPNENVLAPARKESGFEAGVGGTGMLSEVLGCGLGPSSKAMSVEEGKVEDELYRAEAEELSCPLEAELFVPPLPLLLGLLLGIPS